MGMSGNWFWNTNKEVFDGNKPKYAFKEPGKVIEQIMEGIHQKVPPLVALCGDITQNYADLLQSWAVELAKRKYIKEPAVKKFELLELLSSKEPMKIISQKIVRGAEACDRIYFINGLHQMDYDSSGTRMLFAALHDLYGRDVLASPVILNIPAVAFTRIQAMYPGMLEPFICFLASTQAANCIDEAQAVNPGYWMQQGTHTGKTSEVQSIHDRKGKQEKGIEKVPWYVQDNELLKKEKDGMAAFLMGGQNEFKIAAMPGSKRLYFELSIYYQVLITLRIVYLESFAKGNPDIGIVLKSNDRYLKEELRRRCRGVIDNDLEFGNIYMIHPDYQSKAFSEGAAVLNGFIQILKCIS